MSLRQTDIERLGPIARRQIDAAKFAYAEQQRQMDALDAPRSKYRNQKVLFEGKWFDSKAELDRFLELRAELRAGRIIGLIRQPRLRVAVNGIEVCSYVADFVYWRDGREVYEDVKGYRTAIYRLKRKLVKAALGVEIEEIQA